LDNQYNKFILAGASLGSNQNTFPEWGKTYDKHIELSLQLHKIQEIIVIDHMDCGAYRILYNKPNLSKEEELELHKKNLALFKSIINKKYSELVVSAYLMDKDGSVVQEL
jgi:carbonic anhydrase